MGEILMLGHVEFGEKGEVVWIRRNFAGESFGRHEWRKRDEIANGFIFDSFSSIFAARATADGRGDGKNREQSQSRP